jgi:hypothetical protein
VTDGNLDAARPARRRRPPTRAQATVQKQATDSLFKGLDRFGLAPVLLIGLAYIGHTQVVQPIAAAYAHMVETVAENNRLLKEAVEQNSREDAERVLAISAAQAANRALAEENRALNNRILEVLDRMERAVRGREE